MDLTSFFQEQGVDVFSEISIDSLSEHERALVVQFFPGARFVIVFGKEVPVRAYLSPPKAKTQEMLRIAEELDKTAVRIAALLKAEQNPARPVPLYLPVGISEGRVQGVVRLKQVAVAAGIGSLGRNTVLFAPGFGPRLLLSGVVTGLPAGKSGHLPPRDVKSDASACNGCGRCTAVCTTGALGPQGVDAFRCRTVSAWVPSFLVPAVTWMIGRTCILKCMAPLAPCIARVVTISCSLCVTECPHFSGESGKG